MAKKTRTPAVVPQAGYSPGYTWILLFSFLAVVGGCLVHFLELSADYDMEAEPKGTIAVPKPEPLPPLDTSGWKGGISRGPINPADDVAVVTPAPITIPDVPKLPTPDSGRKMTGPVVLRFPTALQGLSSR